MSMTITTDVFCDDCSDWTEGVSAIKIQAKTALAIAKSRGWKRIREGNLVLDLCPACARKREQEEQEDE